MSTENDMPPVAPPPIPTRVENQKKGCGRYVLIGCGALLLIGIAFVGLFAAIMYFGNKSIEPYAGAYFEQVERGEYAQIYVDAHEKLRESATQEQFEDLMHGIHGTLGKFKSKTIRGINMNADLGDSTSTAVYQVTYEKGQAAVTLIFMGAGETKKLAGVHYNSDLIVAALVCPHCHAHLATFSRFCPQCGKEIKWDDAAQ